MKLAVKFYSDVENPDNIPGEWPAEVLELLDEEQIPDGFIEMSLEEYNQYRQNNKAVYDEWLLTHTPGNE